MSRAKTPTVPPNRVSTVLGQLYVLRGKLSIERGRRQQPVLAIEVFCPGCNAKHFHTWGVTWGIFHRVAHCGKTSSECRKGGYFISPANTDENREAMRRYVVELREWEASHAE